MVFELLQLACISGEGLGRRRTVEVELNISLGLLMTSGPLFPPSFLLSGGYWLLASGSSTFHFLALGSVSMDGSWCGLPGLLVGFGFG